MVYLTNSISPKMYDTSDNKRVHISIEEISDTNVRDIISCEPFKSIIRVKSISQKCADILGVPIEVHSKREIITVSDTLIMLYVSNKGITNRKDISIPDERQHQFYLISLYANGEYSETINY